jgi:glycosyltransferase involved in cell wall biosynthesis
MPLTPITIACIVRNVGSGVDAFCQNLRAATRELPVACSLLLVDDGSSDDTYERLRQAAVAGTDLRVLRLSRPFGEGAAVTAALNHSVGEACIVMVGINQALELLAELIGRWREGASIVWTSAPAAEDKGGSAIARITDALSRRTGLQTENAFSLVLIAAPVIRIWRSLPHRDDHLPMTLASYGFRQSTIVSPSVRAPEAVSSAGAMASFVNRLVDNSILPVRIASTVGVLLAAMMLAYVAVVAVRALVFDLGEPGWSSIIVMILFIASAQIISIGILAEYLWRIFQQTRQTPRYIIQDVFGHPSRPLSPSWSLHPLDLDTSVDARSGAK